MPFQIIRADLTQVKADAIVNSANPEPMVGSGVDRAVYEAAGEAQLLAERRKIGDIPPGETRATQAFGLQARVILHTVGPSWEDGKHGERETLRSCYRTALALAASLACESIAFPLISTGVYGFPREEALSIAVEEIRRFLETGDMQVTLVVFDRQSYVLSGGLLGEIGAFIDEHSVRRRARREYGEEGVPDHRRRRDARRLNAAPDGATCAGASLAMRMIQCPAIPPKEEDKDRAADSAAEEEPVACLAPQPLSDAMQPKDSLEEMLSRRGETFQQRLFRLIDASGMDDVQVYKKANIDRKVFSRIRCKADYRPSKNTAVAFAIALELDMDTMRDLLARAEIALSPSNDFDLIITFFVSHHRYDIYEINEALFQYNQPQLGAC